jgi:hypothetical protein
MIASLLGEVSESDRVTRTNLLHIATLREPLTSIVADRLE